MHIDKARRNMNAMAHSAGHVIDSIVNSEAPELLGKIGCHDIKEGCYVKFQGLLSSKPSSDLMASVNAKLDAVIKEERPVKARLADISELTDLKLPDGYTLPTGKPCRVVTIDGFQASPCGGTHVSRMDVFKSIAITKIKTEKKENMTKISYVFE